MLTILAGKSTAARAARELKVSPTAITNWKRQLLTAATRALATGAARASTDSLAHLRAENDALKTVVREATVLARVWQTSAIARRNGSTPTQPARAHRAAKNSAPGPRLSSLRGRRPQGDRQSGVTSSACADSDVSATQ